MTVINNIEIDDIQYKRNIIKEAILNNDPIEDKLHVVLTISNPCLYARRYILIKEMMNRLELEETDVIVYVVELAYKKQRFTITDSKNPRHLQIRTEIPIWHKENMINLGIQKLLPKNWKAIAWIDSDLEFENPSWAKDTLKVLNGTKDIVQIFSHCVDMNMNEEAMSVFVSFGYQYVKGLPYRREIKNFWHPGYAWACTRKAYEKMGGLYEEAILGSADNVMSLSLIQQGLRGINEKSTDDYKESVLRFQTRVKSLRLGYVPGVLRHYFHGSKENRKYGDRWKILLNHNFSPREHLTHDENGILIPTPECPHELLDEILNYFNERNEDSCYQKDKPNQIQLNANEFLVKPETKTEKYDEIESETETETKTNSEIDSDTDMELINEQMMILININSIREAIGEFLGIQ